LAPLLLVLRPFHHKVMTAAAAAAAHRLAQTSGSGSEGERPL
jgi:hypothetical protein